MSTQTSNTVGTRSNADDKDVKKLEGIGTTTEVESSKEEEAVKELRLRPEYLQGLIEHANNNPVGMRPQDFRFDLTKNIETMERIGTPRKIIDITDGSLEASYVQRVLMDAFLVARFRHGDEPTDFDTVVTGSYLHDIVESGLFRDVLLMVPPTNAGVELLEASQVMLERGKDVVMVALIGADPSGKIESFTKYTGEEDNLDNEADNRSFGKTFRPSLKATDLGYSSAFTNKEFINPIPFEGNTNESVYYTGVFNSLLEIHGCNLNFFNGTANLPHKLESDNMMLESIKAVLKSNIFNDKTFIVTAKNILWAIASKELQSKGFYVANFIQNS